mgnify:CR=1 FL=1
MEYFKRAILRYVIALFLMILGLPIIYYLISPITFYLSYLSLFYYNPNLISETAFIIANHQLNFIPACTAASAYLLLIFLTISVDIPIKKALKIILFGSSIILIANIIRIDILIITLLEFGSKAFDTIHLFFWQILSTIFVVFLWIYITKKFKIKDIPIYSDFKRIIKIYKKSKKKK